MTAITTAADLGVPAGFNAATHFIDRHLEAGRGAKVAIECGDHHVTYAELAERVNRCGSVLRESLEVRPEERVVLLLLDTPAFLVAFFAAIKIGAIPVPVNTLWKPADYRHVLADSRARVAIVSEELLPKLEAIDRRDVPALRHVVTTGRGFDDLLSAGSPRFAAEPTSRDAPAFWLYSSGSTGAPKGCVHLQHDMVVCAELFARGVLRLDEPDRCFSVAKLFFAYGLGNAGYFPLAVGATSILMPGPPSAEAVLAAIERHRPTVFFSVPTGFAMLLAQAGGFDLRSIRCAVSAGEALPAPLYERFRQRFGVDILDGLGSTEALHVFTSNRPGAIRPGSSGLIVPGYAAAILDEHERPVPAGEIGDLWVSGDSICAGYWNQHEKTKATIHGDWIRTGDRYRQDAEGFFWPAGRSDDMLKVGGQWVSPIDVETALLTHAAVHECAVVGRDDSDGLTKPAAFVVLRPGVTGSASLAVELQQFVRQTLPEYKRPRWVEFLLELPRTPTGKLQRFKLRG